MSCKKKPTTWQSNWTAPLAYGSLSMSQWVNDSTLSSNGSELSIDFKRNLLNIELADLISIPDTTIIQSVSPSMSGITIPAGFNVVNEIEEHEIQIPDVELKKIRVLNGMIELTVFNPLPTLTSYSVTLPGVTKNGLLFNSTFSLPAGSALNPSSSVEILDLSGHEIDLRGENGLSYNKIQSKLTVITDPAGDEVTIDPSYAFAVEAKIMDLSIDYAQGYFGNQINSDSLNYQVPYLDKIADGLVDFPASTIKFDINNSMKLGLESTIDYINNINYNNNSISLQSNQIGAPFYISPATGTWDNISTSNSSVSFNSTNSNIESFLENLGFKQNISFSLELNPWGNINGGWDEIFSNSRINLGITAQMPLNIGLDNFTLRDTFSFDWTPTSQSVQLNNAIFNLKTINAFPFSCIPTIYLLDNDYNILHVINSSSSIETSLLGEIDPQDGIQKKESNVEFLISENIINDMSLVKNIIVEAIFDSTDPQTNINLPVSIPSGAFISFNLLGNFNLNNSY